MKLSTKLTATSLFFFVGLLFSCHKKIKEPTAPGNTDSVQLFAGNNFAGVDQSPLDISYYPLQYPQNKMSVTQPVAPPVARIIYSRPHKKGRIIFSNDEKSLCRYGKPWRLGANEATEIDFFKPVVINGNNVPAGRYVMYCVPFADRWIIALNGNLDSWGLQIDPSKDLFRTEVPVQQQSPAIEDFTIVFQEASYGADILFTWDVVKILLPVTFSK